MENRDSLKSLSKYFDMFTELRDTLTKVLEAWDTPVIVVFGPQNSGKSTLLERLAMISIFPKGNGLCTRMPIRVRLRTGESKKVLSIIAIDKNDKETVLDSLSIKDDNTEPIVSKYMNQLVKESQKNDRQGIRSDRLIEIEVWEPDLPNIDLLDLPGMVVTPGPNDEKDLPQQTIQLVKDTIKKTKDRAIYLAVREAGEGAQQSLTIKILDEHPEIKKFCLGVLTKSDQYSSDLILGQIEESQKGWPLGYGYIPTMNKYIKGNSLDQQAENEKKWFLKNDDFKELINKNMIGSTALLNQLAVAYHKYLGETWFLNTIDLLNVQIMLKEYEMTQLGSPKDISKVSDTKNDLNKLLIITKKEVMLYIIQVFSNLDIFTKLNISSKIKKEDISFDISDILNLEDSLENKILKTMETEIQEISKLSYNTLSKNLNNDMYKVNPITDIRFYRYPELIKNLLFTNSIPNIKNTFIEYLTKSIHSFLSEHISYVKNDIFISNYKRINQNLIYHLYQSLNLLYDTDRLISSTKNNLLLTDLSKEERNLRNLECTLIEEAKTKISSIFEEFKHKKSHKNTYCLIIDSNIQGYFEKKEIYSKITNLLRKNQNMDILLWHKHEKNIKNLKELDDMSRKIEKLIQIKSGEINSKPLNSKPLNSLSIDMVYCSNEKLQKDINEAFWMGQTQVIQDVWENVMGWNNSYRKGKFYPITNVSLFDCLMFCNKLSKLHGLEPSYDLKNIKKNGEHIIYADFSQILTANGYRLPTRLEWEYSAKANQTFIYSGSNDINEVAWFYTNYIQNVKLKKANAWNLYDMSGNVWEYCQDLNTTITTIHGGSFSDYERNCQISIHQIVAKDNYSQNNIGFRLAKNYDINDIID